MVAEVFVFFRQTHDRRGETKVMFVCTSAFEFLEKLADDLLNS
jgi:hypothetical protein